MKKQLESLMTRKSSNSKKMLWALNSKDVENRNHWYTIYLGGWAGWGGELQYKRDWVLIRRFEKNPYSVLWVWHELFFTPKRYQTISNTTEWLSPVIHIDWRLSEQPKRYKNWVCNSYKGVSPPGTFCSVWSEQKWCDHVFKKYRNCWCSWHGWREKSHWLNCNRE